MAIATFLQAKAWGKPRVLLPVVMAARFQQSALLCRADGGIGGPADLAGRRIEVRAYSQTTGMWLRGILADEVRRSPRAGSLDHVRRGPCGRVPGPAMGRARTAGQGAADDAA